MSDTTTANVAVLATMCGHCGDPIVEGERCGSNELDRVDSGDTTTIQWGPHEVTEDSTTELACPCGSTNFRYEENVLATRNVESFDGEQNILFIAGYCDYGDGDDSPGLVCNDYAGGCGRSLELPDDVEVEWT